MSARTRKLPHLSSIFVGVTYILVFAFFAWGFSTPALDQVWRHHHELKIGKTGKLKKAERKSLNKAMKRHPRLAKALLQGAPVGIISAHNDGWIATPNATILRTPAAKNIRRMNFDVQTPEDLLPLSISLRTKTWKKKLKFTKQGTETFLLPELGDTVEIIELKMKGRRFRKDRSMLGLRVQFEEEGSQP
jgi:hypothetical protein